MSQKDKTSRMAEEINENLKRIYDQVANEEIPSRLMKQLEQLRAQDEAKRTEAPEHKDDADG